MAELDNSTLVKNDVMKPFQPTLENLFAKEVKLRKEANSQHIYNAYYIPLACTQIIKEQGDITNADKYKLENLAMSLMFKDLAYGKLNEFYKFESEV